MNALLRDELTHELPCRDTRPYEVAPDWERPASGERRRGYMLLTTARADTTSDSPSPHPSDRKLGPQIHVTQDT